MPDDRLIALVTGANRGLGLEVSRRLAAAGMRVYLGSRDLKKGQQAAEQLREQGFEVEPIELDVTHNKEVSAARKHIEKNSGSLSVLINNAGVYVDEGASVFDVLPESFRRTMAVNFYGALGMCREFLPPMVSRGYGRVVNVSSGCGALTDMQGHDPAYRVSKTALNALTRIVAVEAGGGNIKVNSVCPGWVRTDMGGKEATLSVEEGAEGIVWAATLPDDGPTGGFFRRGKAIDW